MHQIDIPFSFSGWYIPLYIFSEYQKSFSKSGEYLFCLAFYFSEYKYLYIFRKHSRSGPFHIYCRKIYLQKEMFLKNTKAFYLESIAKSLDSYGIFSFNFCAPPLKETHQQSAQVITKNGNRFVILGIFLFPCRQIRICGCPFLFSWLSFANIFPANYRQINWRRNQETSLSVHLVQHPNKKLAKEKL